jgi:hypothetical protein
MKGPATLALLSLAATLAGCSAYEYRHAIQWDARDLIWLSEASQVQVRAAQSHVFETDDRTRMLEAIVSSMQDLDFQIEVLDPRLGIVSGKKFEALGRRGSDPLYHLYDDESLLIFSKTYRSWGPFWHRSDLVRLTATVRKRNESQLIVRASAQHDMQAIETPAPYQAFFRTLEQALFARDNALP